MRRSLLNGGIMKKLAFHLLAVAAFVGLASGAEAKGWGGELTAAKSKDQWGAELGVGYGAAIGPITIRPVAGAFLYRGDNTRYYEQTFSNGQSRCRDRSNGQFASSGNCNNTAVSFYGKIEATVAIPAFAEIGIGGRYANETIKPYGLISVPVAPNIKVTGQGGDRYFSAGLRVGF